MAVELQFWKQAVALPPGPWPSDLAAAARSEESEEEQAQKEDKPWTGGNAYASDYIHNLFPWNRVANYTFLLRQCFLPTARLKLLQEAVDHSEDILLFAEAYHRKA